MTNILRSDFDYAVVAYARECLDEAGKESVLNAMRAEAQTLEHKWHEPSPIFMQPGIACLSRFQPYAHGAYTAVHEADWLPNSRLYFLFDPAQNKFLLAMYGMSWPPRGV